MSVANVKTYQFSLPVVAASSSIAAPASPDSSNSSVWLSVDDLLKNFASEHEEIAKRLKLIEERRRRRTLSAADEAPNQPAADTHNHSNDDSPTSSPSATPSSSAFFARSSTVQETKQHLQLQSNQQNAVISSELPSNMHGVSEERQAHVHEESSSATRSAVTFSISSLQEISTLSSPSSKRSDSDPTQLAETPHGTGLLSSNTAYFFPQSDLSNIEENDSSEKNSGLDESSIRNTNVQHTASTVDNQYCLKDASSHALSSPAPAASSSRILARGVAAAAGLFAVAGVLFTLTPTKDRNSASKPS